ncbi:hypothetical protein TKK_0019167 [Trichogramma kaykai]|uniref:Uncharacterized protein n=1 Tax=Trichogramma kaykai TaxID=54128 RepID=A0ABD2VTK2_9HYME
MKNLDRHQLGSLILILLSIIAKTSSSIVGFQSSEVGNYFPGYKSYFGEESFYDDSIFYALCETPDSPKSTKFCRFGLDRSLTNETYECQIELRTKNAKHEILEEIRVVAFDEYRVIIAWQEPEESFGYHMRLANLDYRDCVMSLKQFDVQVVSILREVRFVVYDNSYEVIFENWMMCDRKLCRVRIDLQGKLLAGPAAWFTISDDDMSFMRRAQQLSVIPIKPRSYDFDHLLIKQFKEQSFDARGSLLEANDTIKIVSILRDDGSKKQLINYRRSGTNISSSLHQFAYSLVHKLIGICYQLNNRIYCSQFDRTGKLKFQVQLDFSYTLHEMTMYNLPLDEGFILLTTECLSDTCDSSMKHEHHLDIISPAGDRTKLTRFDRMECSVPRPTKMELHFYQNTDHSYCLSQICYDADVFSHINQFPYLKHIATCFSKDLVT